MWPGKNSTLTITGCTTDNSTGWYEYHIPKEQTGTDRTVTVPMGEWTQNSIKEANMETLYRVIVVSKDRKVYDLGMVVAEDEETAKFEVDVGGTLKQHALKPKDVTIVCEEIDAVKVREEVKKVQVVDDG